MVGKDFRQDRAMIVNEKNFIGQTSSKLETFDPKDIKKITDKP